MFCAKCGKPVDPDRSFCKYCGAAIKKRVTQPGSDADDPENKPQPAEVDTTPAIDQPEVKAPEVTPPEIKAPAVKPPETKKPTAKPSKSTPSEKRGKGKKIFIAAVASLLAVGILIGVLFITGAFGKKGDNDELVRPDARSYMNDYGTITKEIPVAEGKAYTEAQAYAELTGRGFSGDSITASYDMSGNLTDDTVINPNGSAKHPYYKTMFYSDNDIIWVVTYINGHVMAQAYVDEAFSGESRMYYYTEGKTTDFYDSKYNSFFEIQPDTSKYVLKTVGNITADVLNGIEHWEVVDR